MEHKKHRVHLVYRDLSRRFRLGHAWEGFYADPTGWAALYDPVPRRGESPDCQKLRWIAAIFKSTSFLGLQDTAEGSIDTGGLSEEHGGERNVLGHIAQEYRRV